MTPLRQRMIEDMRVRNYSPKTIRNYVAQVRLFAESFGQSPANLGVEQIRTYQVYLVQGRGISWSSFNITVSRAGACYGGHCRRPQLRQAFEST
jgi:integrase/recombinase XerD